MAYQKQIGKQQRRRNHTLKLTDFEDQLVRAGARALGIGCGVFLRMAVFDAMHACPRCGGARFIDWHCSDCGWVWDDVEGQNPTPEEIREETAKFRASWSDATRRRRSCAGERVVEEVQVRMGAGAYGAVDQDGL